MPDRTLPDASARKPRLRGVWHQWGFFVSLLSGAVLIATARPVVPCLPP